MATPVTWTEQETTQYEYDSALPCMKVKAQELKTQLLPPLYTLVFCVGLLGNGMVVVILTKYRRLCIMTNIYLLNLAISDLLFLVTLPFWVHYAKSDEWVFGRGMCRLLSGLYDVGLHGEVFFIILLTIDRYLAVVHAVFALRARTVAFGIISSVFTWVLAVLAALPDFIFHDVSEEHGMFCTVFYPHGTENAWKRFFAVRTNVLSLVLPLLVMVFCYSGIIKTLVRCPSKKKCKAIRLIFVIMVVFFLFWAPYNLATLLSSFQIVFFDTDCEQTERLDMAILVTEVITYTHCCINPVIYAFVGEKFREHLCHFFHTHVAMPLGKCNLFLPTEKQDRTSSASPSTGEQELSAIF